MLPCAPCRCSSNTFAKKQDAPFFNPFCSESCYSRCFLCKQWRLDMILSPAIGSDEEETHVWYCKRCLPTPQEKYLLNCMSAINPKFSVWSHGRREDSCGYERNQDAPEQPCWIRGSHIVLGDLDDAWDILKLQRFGVSAVLNLCIGNNPDEKEMSEYLN